MSTAPFKPRRGTDARRLAWLTAATLVALAALCPAFALNTDRNQPIKVAAGHFKSSRAGVTVLSGHVVITQGTLVATGDKGTAHRNAGHSVKRIVLEGSPATLKQALEGGGQMHARADTIDYQVGIDTVILSGHAQVVQQDQGQFNGAHLVYNTRTGAISGEGGKHGRVHLVLQPSHPAAAATVGGTP